ncbi:zinc ribbon domain-containing protein [Halomicrobium urmianum]|uniref:zinc ribbon domain-containing protein n=1 Tax=Halomicrobium urmianum TaxID=1586233 RepID=UPI001CD9879F|nr:zinc ribbon domain-containing protein [Halomicrobium urmianum]
MLDIVSLLQTKLGRQSASELESDAAETEQSSDLYECSTCGEVLIEPSCETCPKCESGSLQKV